jgi:putative transcriptional regulator
LRKTENEHKEKFMSMEADTPSYLMGQMLMAMPNLADPNFSKTVTCICEHTDAGALGIVINRIHPFISAREIFKELKIDYTAEAESIRIFIGGPVHVGELFILHGPPFHWKGCVNVTHTLALSNTRDVLESIARGEGVISSFMIALGCAGWGRLQLESEISANAWLTGPVSDELLFDVPVEYRWERAMELIGIDPMKLTDATGSA